MTAELPPQVDAAADTLDQLAEQAGAVATSHVLASPGDRAQRIARILWQGDGDGTVGAARRAAAQMVGRITGNTPRIRTVAQHHARAFDNRLEYLRASGEPLTYIDGRWYRRSYSKKQRWTPVETPQNLVQQRVYRGALRARAAAELYARSLGYPSATVRDGNVDRWVSPQVEERYRRGVALEAGRVAHDVTVDAHRDATWEAMATQAEVIGWQRVAERGACGACLALATGRLEPVGRGAFYRHTRCRCLVVPVTATSPPLPSGLDVWDSMSRDEQDAVFHRRGGRRKADLLRSGRITLADLVTVADERLERTDYVVRETPLADLESRSA